MPYFSRDDIAQICTPPGPAPVGALRLSGDNAFAILATVCEGLDDALAGRPRRGVHDSRFRLALLDKRIPGGERRERTCPARVFLMPAPHSYTREDVAEVHLPGAPALLKAGLEALVRAGARPAAPGEFTFRAFRNGRIGLGQAEAVEEVVRAGDAAARRQALARMGDRNLLRAREWRERVLGIAARLEAALDFSGEELDGDAASGLADLLRELEREGAGLAAAGVRPVSELPHIALVGLANAGKSSLYNALLESDAALVSPEASTTRDSLRREVGWEGTRFVLSDNPGYHPEGSGGGREAADRATLRMGGEDIACWVVDGSRPLSDREREFARLLPERVVIALNKEDLPHAVDIREAEEAADGAGRVIVDGLRVSAVSGAGLAALRRRLGMAAGGMAGSGVWNDRERLELAAALGGCRDAVRELAGPGRLELAAEDLRLAARAFSRVLGEGYAGEVLARIFGNFCIGK